MSRALLDALVSDEVVTPVDETDAEVFAAQGGPRIGVLFFAGDPEKKLETNDVAVVLRELLAVHHEHLRAALVSAGAERALMKRFQVRLFPSLVFVHGGEILDVLPKIQDWSVYAEKIPHYIARADVGASA